MAHLVTPTTAECILFALPQDRCIGHDSIPVQARGKPQLRDALCVTSQRSFEVVTDDLAEGMFSTLSLSGKPIVFRYGDHTDREPERVWAGGPDARKILDRELRNEFIRQASNVLTITLMDGIVESAESGFIAPRVISCRKHEVYISASIASIAETADFRAWQYLIATLDQVAQTTRPRDRGIGSRLITACEEQTRREAATIASQIKLSPGCYLPVQLSNAWPHGETALAVLEITGADSARLSGSLFVASADLIPRAGAVLTRRAAITLYGRVHEETVVVGEVL